MKKIWKTRKGREGVSPVIATILMVAITVVLAAVLYVMVLQFQPPPDFDLGLGLSQEDRTTTTVSLMVASAPNNAKVEGTEISITRDGIPTPVNNVTIYSPAGHQVAWFESELWSYANGYDADSLDYKTGMTLVITGDTISSGDKIKMSSADGYYGITTHDVS